MKKHTAFSLIEISIVILIIGILVAGVTQGSRLIDNFRLQTAKTLTQSSPVASIKDLAAWYETTSDASFDDSEESNNTPVTNWYDINPQQITKNNSTKSTADQKALFIEKAKNGLPVLRFDGTDDNYGNTTLTLGSEMSMFAVASTDSSAGWRRIIHVNNYFYLGIGSGTSQFAGFYGNGAAWNTANSYGADAVLNLNQHYILSSILRGTDNRGYVNGVDVGNATGFPTETKSASTGLLISLSSVQTWSGDIGEIIIFNRGLNSEERKSVEKYLSKKWGIPVS